MAYTQLAQITARCAETGKAFWQIVQDSDCQERDVTPAQSFADMQRMYRAMEQADAAYDPSLRSASGMAGGDGAKFSAYRMRENRLLGDYLTEVMERALKMAESNACMKRIVAAPTAGSCGVIPAVLLIDASCRQVTEEKLVEALYVAAGIGEVIAASASIAGAEGGCQAEVGAASAMAASAAVELFGGTPAQCLDAASFAIVNILGLVCDPIGGLVENPCQNRNAMGASNALISAELSMAGIKSITPIDETIGVMYAVGRSIPSELRETSMGGMAVAKSACEACAACAKETQK